jgi:tetratricopeptide (TPR) repeat protein
MIRYVLLALLSILSCAAAAQPNCLIYKAGSPERAACEIYLQAIEFPQGSIQSQLYFDRAIALCPTFAEAYHEKSVPFLKRGDFLTWKNLMDEAVRLQPKRYLADRGWCRFKFLHDYGGALADIARLCELTRNQPGRSGDGNYDLRIVAALCQRELGDLRGALATFNACIADNKAQGQVGLYDYLHRGVTKLRLRDYSGALADFKQQRTVNGQLAENYYYTALALRKQYQPAAVAQMQTARQLWQQGYRLNDPYLSMPDEISLADIERFLQP